MKATPNRNPLPLPALPHDVRGGNLRKLGEWWIELPKWERELRLVLILKDQLIGLLKPPEWLLDMSRSVDPPSSSNDPRSLTYPGTFLGLAHGPQAEPHASEGPPVLQSFERFGCLSVPLEKPEDVITLVEQRVRQRLTLMRPVEFYVLEDEDSLRALRAVALLAPLRRLLADLVADVDIPQVYGTFRLSGELFNWMWRFYRGLKEQRGTIPKDMSRRRELRRLHQALRTFERYEDLDSPTKAKVLDLIAAYKGVKEPSADVVQRYRHQLGIYRESRDSKSESFWTPIAGWTVRQLIDGLSERGCTERSACEIVARLLTNTFPRLRHEWTAEEAKARYYRSL